MIKHRSAMDSISSTVNCHVFDSIVVDFDEGVLCSSLQTGDFNVALARLVIIASLASAVSIVWAA